MLRRQIQRGVCVVAKSVTPERIKRNGVLFDWQLSEQDMASFATLNVGWRHLLFPEAAVHPDYLCRGELPHAFVVPKGWAVPSSGTSG
mmetsp:Transcript_22118/g.48479  ORF Transcript_22118/g.48479 Transcript_22118/m.48479 type:complete len:88 (+) Transcript_22118:93-356(+)